MAYVLAIEPHPEQARILREEIRARARTKLTVTESLSDALAAIDLEVPALVLVNSLLPLQDEHRLVARLRELPLAGVPQVLFLPPLTPQHEAPKRSLFGFSRAQPFKPPPCDAATFAVHLCEYLGDPERAGRDRRTAMRIEQVDWATVLVDGVTVELLDLSATGAQLRSTVSLQPGGVVQILLKRGTQTVQCEADVVWGAGNRAGVTFKPEDQQEIERLYSSKPARGTKT